MLTHTLNCNNTEISFSRLSMWMYFFNAIINYIFATTFATLQSFPQVPPAKSINNIGQHHLLFFFFELSDLLIFHLKKRRKKINASLNIKQIKNYLTNYILIVKRILLFFSVLREKIIISNFRSNQTLKGKGKKNG